MAKRIALGAALLTFVLGVGYIEYLLPVIPTAPGAKLGIANVIFLCFIDNGRIKWAVMLNLARITLSAILFGGVVSALYSLLGGLFSFSLMYLLTRREKFGYIGISIAAGAAHNIGQGLIACILLSSGAVISYLPYLILAGGVSGGIVGLLSFSVNRYLIRLKIYDEIQ